MAAKAKKTGKKHAEVRSGKKMSPVKPLTENFSLNYGKTQPTYTPQKG